VGELVSGERLGEKPVSLPSRSNCPAEFGVYPEMWRREDRLQRGGSSELGAVVAAVRPGDLSCGVC